MPLRAVESSSTRPPARRLRQISSWRRGQALDVMSSRCLRLARRCPRFPPRLSFRAGEKRLEGGGESGVRTWLLSERGFQSQARAVRTISFRLSTANYWRRCGGLVARMWMLSPQTALTMTATEDNEVAKETGVHPTSMFWCPWVTWETLTGRRRRTSMHVWRHRVTCPHVCLYDRVQASAPCVRAVLGYVLPRGRVSLKHLQC